MAHMVCPPARRRAVWPPSAVASVCHRFATLPRPALQLAHALSAPSPSAPPPPPSAVASSAGLASLAVSSLRLSPFSASARFPDVSPGAFAAATAACRPGSVSLSLRRPLWSREGCLVTDSPLNVLLTHSPSVSHIFNCRVHALTRRCLSSSQTPTASTYASQDAEASSSHSSSAAPSSDPHSGAIVQRQAAAVGGLAAGESAIEALAAASLKEAEEKALHARRHQGIELYPGGPVDRYGPPRDPSTLLLEPHKLTEEERVFQGFFVATPWIVFMMMLATPIFLANYHVEKLNARAAFTKQVAEELLRDEDVPSFRLCTFQDLREVVEQPTHAFICYFHPLTLSSQIVVPLLRDIAACFQRLGVRASVAAVDLSHASIPPHVHRELPSALAPHGQLLLPFAFGGQQPAVTDFEGPAWNATQIVKAVAEYVPGAHDALQHTQEIDDVSEQLSDCLFALAFVDGAAAEEANDGKQHKLKSSSASAGTAGKAEMQADATNAANPVARTTELSVVAYGGKQALRICQEAREKLRSAGMQGRRK
ncbi:hypothetical protein BESB_021210 [Besnoitia besnoiti]|uniref:Transmembrane protein n=1 Tax=Besnoitia besnoiti TaxID=94643 RepID=A0A2A9M9X3_BESBE|nr:hypothetical protein BESB_021210 [Besnoitia besnoiti]PFH32180.1 hypothetical protein BESB_021210 [Besnoitia besnoiti]